MGDLAAGGVGAALRAATARLAAVSDTARLDAEVLMAHALGVERGALLLDPDRFVVPAAFAALIERRAAREPVAYIVGARDFWTIRLMVGPGVLIPRGDSETLIEAALAASPTRLAPLRLLDLGTGPGTLLLALLSEYPGAHGLGLDRSAVALDYARRNAAALRLDERAQFREGDWTKGIGGTFDIILCNPPYIEADAALMRDVADFEPPEALFAGADGLEDYRQIIPGLASLLTPRGVAVLEIGAAQRDAVTALAHEAGFVVQCRRDLGGRDRALVLTRPDVKPQ